MRDRRVRVQAIVCRSDRVLMVKHRVDGQDYWCLPGGALENGESLEQGALRELEEECGVDGRVVRQTSETIFGDGERHVTFLVDIGDQSPCLGIDPEVAGGEAVLIDVGWLALTELPERDRTWLWAAGLLGVGDFMDEVCRWGDVPSYPVVSAKPLTHTDLGVSMISEV